MFNCTVQFALFKLFSLPCLSDISMTMFEFFHIFAKLISRQVCTWSFVSTPFEIKAVLLRNVYSLTQSIWANSDPRLSYINGWHSSNKQLSFLWLDQSTLGFHMFNAHPISPDYSTVLVYCTLIKLLQFEIESVRIHSSVNDEKWNFIQLQLL